MDVDGERLRADLTTNATFGGIETDQGPGRTVLTGSEADKGCRDYFRERLREAGCSVRVDPVGNIAGRWVPPGADPDALPVATGSHLDSVPQGGIFDGPLGVYGALEALRTLQAAPTNLDRPVDVVAFTEDEGARFETGLLGSAVAAGEMGASSALALEDAAGTSLADRLTAIGYHGDATIDPGAWAGWVELHIEQGQQLWTAGDAVGVVETIAGLTNCRIEITGATNHAGTTAMAHRRDALAAAADLIQAVETSARELAETERSVVGTVGAIDVHPNTKNVVPGRVTARTDVRAAEPPPIERLVAGMRERLSAIATERPVTTTIERVRDIPPTDLSAAGVEAAVAGVEATGHPWQHLHSGALHDTAMIGGKTDAAMLFAPSEEGVSHSPAEWTPWADCTRATAALAATLQALDRSAGS